MRMTSTKGAGVDRVKTLIYGPSGAGKTSLIGTIPDCESAALILSAEAGLLPLAHLSIGVIEIDSLTTLELALHRMRTSTRLRHTWVVLDSISDIAERCLAELKETNKDPRRAYGEMQDRVTAALMGFRELPVNVVILSKQERIQDDEGRIFYGPAMPGKKTGPALPYHFDLVLAYRRERAEDGAVYRWLQSEGDDRYSAKDRSGCLDPAEPPDLGHIQRKILSGRRRWQPGPSPVTNQETTNAV